MSQNETGWKVNITHKPISLKEYDYFPQQVSKMNKHYLCALNTVSHSPEAEFIMFCGTGGLVGAVTFI
jgi:hypothetical protein